MDHGVDCQISGCAGELCFDKNGPVKSSVCLHRAENDCYKNAECKEINGSCQWEMDEELTKCLAKFKVSVQEPIYPTFVNSDSINSVKTAFNTIPIAIPSTATIQQ
jgi:eight-cysteine-cluster-containing protein